MSKAKPDGEILLKTRERIAVRGHISTEAMRKITGWRGPVLHRWWRHAFIPYAQRQLFRVERSRYVEARKPGAGAFKVTILEIRRNT